MKITVVALNKIHLPSARQWPLGYLGKGYKLRGQHFNPLYMAMLYRLRYSFRRPQKKNGTKYMHYKKLSDNENINLKDAQLFVARQLAQSGKQDKTFTGPGKC
jgi:hypothetical protein